MMKYLLCAVALLFSAFAQAAPVVKGEGWLYWRIGSATDVQTPTVAGVAFEGGGTDVNKLYEWMCARSGKGDFLVLRASGNADYNPYIARLCPRENSVATLKIFNRRGAFDPAVLGIIQKAEAIFISGGDQSNYVNFWQNTPVQDAINQAAARGVPVGGTSAGNAILGQFAFSALNNTIYSKTALADCFARSITIDNGFLNVNANLGGVITDDHFAPRKRMGRLVTFLARIVQSGVRSQAYGIALNENTAFLMNADGSGTVVGSSNVYFLRTPGPPEVCAPLTPVTFTGLPVYKIDACGTFNVANWTGTNGTAYTVSATQGVLTSTQKFGKIY